MNDDDDRVSLFANAPVGMIRYGSFMPRPRSNVEVLAELAREQSDTALAMLHRIERGRMRIAAVEGVCDAARTLASGASNALVASIELGGKLEPGEEVPISFQVGAPIPGTGSFFRGPEYFGISGFISIRRRRF